MIQKYNNEEFLVFDTSDSHTLVNQNLDTFVSFKVTNKHFISNFKQHIDYSTKITIGY